MKNKNHTFYIGIDTHKFLHTICVMDEELNKLLTFDVTNQPMYYEEALTKICSITKKKELIFGLEDTQSYGLFFAQFLVKKGYLVKQINPSLASIYRSGLPNYHKTDEYDAYCCAKVLKDMHKRLPDFEYSTLFSNLSLLVSMRQQIIKQQATSYLMLHAQLSKTYVGYPTFFCNLKMASALAFFKRFPSPRLLQGYDAKQLSIKMREDTFQFAEKRSQKILESIALNGIPYENEVTENIIVSILEDIEYQNEKLASIEHNVSILLKETGYQLRTIPGISIITEAKIVGAIGDIQRFKNHHQLARYAGVAPTRIGSGGKNKDYSSKGGHRALRATLYFLSIGLIGIDAQKRVKHPVFRSYYEKKVSEGKTSSQALVSVMRLLIRILYRMMKNQSEWIVPQIEEKE